MRLTIAICSALLLLPIGALTFSNAYGAQNSPSAQTVWQLLDYIAVDYPAAVDDGQVISELEYAEMMEFAVAVTTRLADLPPTAAQSDLLPQADALKAAIARKAPAAEVAKIARALADALIVAYPVTLAPSAPPDLARAKVLYAEQCASCHGAYGQGDGSAAQGLEPPPIAFTDRSRARERSLFGLYQVIEQGIEGTSMASYDWLSDEDRWALAFYVGGLAFSDEEARNGKQAWASDRRVRTIFPDLESVTRTTPAASAERLGENGALALTAYLRRVGHWL